MWCKMIIGVSKLGRPKRSLPMKVRKRKPQRFSSLKNEGKEVLVGVKILRMERGWIHLRSEWCGWSRESKEERERRHKMRLISSRWLTNPGNTVFLLLLISDYAAFCCYAVCTKTDRNAHPLPPPQESVITVSCLTTRWQQLSNNVSFL